MIDPPREGVKDAIRNCKNAGIKTVMITGDHIRNSKSNSKRLRNFNTQFFSNNWQRTR